MYQRSDRFKKLRRKKILYKSLKYGSVFLLFSISSIFFLVNFPVLQIRNFNISGLEKIDLIEIQNLVQEELDKDFLFFFKDNNIIFFTEDDFIEKIKQSNKKIQKIDLTFTDGWQKMEIKIKEHSEEFLFCELKRCFLMDDEGILFGEVNSEEYENLVKLIGPLQQFRVQVKELNNFITGLKNNSLIAKKIEQDENNNFIVFLKNDVKLLLSSNFKSEEVLERLNIILTYRDFDINQKRHDFKNNVYYINLRYGRRIYYCIDNLKCAGNY